MAHVTAEAVLVRASDNVELARTKDTVFSTTAQSTESILRRVCAKLSREIAGRFYDALRNDTK
jgi:hypothetical protein